MRSIVHSLMLALFTFNPGAVAEDSEFKLYSPVYQEDLMPHEKLKKDVYVYQNQSMREVNWFYAGLVPRLEDPSRIEVVLSKQGFTMRVSLHMTKEEVALYPLYLIERARETSLIMQEQGIAIFPDPRNQGMYQNYRNKINAIAARLSALPKSQSAYREDLYQLGLELLRKNFPSNIFLSSNANSFKWNESEEKSIALVAHFVYPITTHRFDSLPPAGTYVQSQAYSGVDGVVEERRTYYSKAQNHIFSGYPAFWISSIGSGIGVHGPIRYSRLRDRNPIYGSGESAMKRFWSDNEFIKNPLLPPSQADGSDINSNLRWDLVRTKDSGGCFRAETLELRHLLPSSRDAIFKSIKWQVIDQVDRVQDPVVGNYWYVDVDYYMISPYKRPLERREWVAKHQFKNFKGSQADRDVQIESFINSSYQFEYLDPSTVEIVVPGDLGKKSINQGRLNRAGKIPTLQL